MSKSSSVKLTFFLLIAAFLSVALCTSDLPSVLAQNTNSSTTEEAGSQNNNANMGRRRSSGRRGNRRRGNRRRAMSDNASDNTNTSNDASMSDNTNASGNTTMSSGQTGGTTTDTSGGEPTDLSGTYTGKLSMPEHGINGEEGTLTITGNQYTLTAGSMTHSGRFLANTTRGYTGVAMELGPGESGQPAPFISLRARRSGDSGLTLMSVPGETHKLSFMTAGASGGGRRMGSRRGHRGHRQ